MSGSDFFPKFDKEVNDKTFHEFSWRAEQKYLEAKFHGRDILLPLFGWYNMLRQLRNLAETMDMDTRHLIERRLFQEPHEFGGYFLDNGASVCEPCHLLAEKTDVSVEELRERCGITRAVVPSHLYDEFQYTKWGDIILPNGQRLKGELFHDESVQKVIKHHLSEYSKYWKHPRLHHVPWTDYSTEDDRVLPNMSHFEGREVIVTNKIDGQ